MRSSWRRWTGCSVGPFGEAHRAVLPEAAGRDRRSYPLRTRPLRAGLNAGPLGPLPAEAGRGTKSRNRRFRSRFPRRSEHLRRNNRTLGFQCRSPTPARGAKLRLIGPSLGEQQPHLHWWHKVHAPAAVADHRVYGVEAAPNVVRSATTCIAAHTRQAADCAACAISGTVLGWPSTAMQTASPTGRCRARCGQIVRKRSRVSTMAVTAEVLDGGCELDGLACCEQHVKKVGRVTRHRWSRPYPGWHVGGCS